MSSDVAGSVTGAAFVPLAGDAVKVLAMDSAYRKFHSVGKISADRPSVSNDIIGLDQVSQSQTKMVGVFVDLPADHVHRVAKNEHGKIGVRRRNRHVAEPGPMLVAGIKTVCIC